MTTNDLDADKLLLRLHTGKTLSPAELAEVIQILSHYRGENEGVGASIDEIYAFLVVLGETRAFEQRQVLERYLELHDPLTVSLVLEILCLKWELTDEYLERAIQFAVGASWDYENDVQQMALKILGEFLFNKQQHGSKNNERTRELKVLELLYSTFADESLTPWVRHSAYSAICRASGKLWEEIPPDYAQLDFSGNSPVIDYSLLDAVAMKFKRVANS